MADDAHPGSFASTLSGRAGSDWLIARQTSVIQKTFWNLSVKWNTQKGFIQTLFAKRSITPLSGEKLMTIDPARAIHSRRQAIRPKRWLKVAVSVAVLAALAACGGDGDSSSPQATASADSVSVPWNKAATVDVTANDVFADGTPSVSIKTGPAHGKATVSGTTVQYTPDAGYFGSDALRYAVSVGNASSEADVAIAVTATLTLSGVVRDATLGGAKVTATVGSTVLPAVSAGAKGAYTLKVETSDPAVFISLKAQGVEAQSKVVLSTLVGDARDAAAASTRGAVTSAALPALNITHLSTATAVLTGQALGKAPASSAEAASVQERFTSTQVIDMAAVIKLVADKGVALPDDSPDTLALVSNADAYQGFVQTQIAGSKATFDATRQEVLADPKLAVPVMEPASGETLTTLLVFGQGASATLAERIILRSDHTAQVESYQVRSATWQAVSGDLRLTYDEPIVDTDIVSGETNDPIELRHTGRVVRQLAVSAGAAKIATLLDVSETKYLDGPRKGTIIQDQNEWLSTVVVTHSTTLGASDVVAGTRWGGVLTTEKFDLFIPPYVDVLRIVDATHAQFERSKAAATWRLVDGKLEVTSGDAVFTYSRLFLGPLGEERWLAEKRIDSKLVWVYDAPIFKAQDGAAFTSAGLVNRWKGYLNFGLSSDQFYVNLASDGTGSETNVVAGQPDDPSDTSDGYAWNLDADGQMVESRSYCDAAGCGPHLRRAWKLLGAVDNRIYVIERRFYGSESAESYRLNVYTAAR